jgi:hypothetical protein
MYLNIKISIQIKVHIQIYIKIVNKCKYNTIHENLKNVYKIY